MYGIDEGEMEERWIHVFECSRKNGDWLQKTRACLNNTCGDDKVAISKRTCLLTKVNVFSLFHCFFL